MPRKTVDSPGYYVHRGKLVLSVFCFFFPLAQVVSAGEFSLEHWSWNYDLFGLHLFIFRFRKDCLVPICSRHVMWTIKPAFIYHCVSNIDVGSGLTDSLL